MSMMTGFKESTIKVDTVDIAADMLIELHLERSFPHFSHKEIIFPNRIINSERTSTNLPSH